MAKRYEWERKSPRAALAAALERRPSGARYGLSVYVMHSTGGVRSIIAWFDEIDELVKFFELYLPRAMAYPDPLPLREGHEDWTMPFDVPDVPEAEVGAWLTDALHTLRWTEIGREIRWAGPVSDLLESSNDFCESTRLSFGIHWERAHPPSTWQRFLSRLKERLRPDRTCRVERGLEREFLRWLDSAVLS